MKVDKAKDDSAKKEKASGSANAAAECKSNSESDGAWVAMDSDDETVLKYSQMRITLPLVTMTGFLKSMKTLVALITKD